MEESKNPQILVNDQEIEEGVGLRAKPSEGHLYFALHTSDPGDPKEMGPETTYASYVRVPGFTTRVEETGLWRRMGRALLKFLAWLVSGHVCPQCKTARTGHREREWDLFGKERGLHYCDDCGHKNRLANMARRKAREREDRIEEMAEAFRRSRTP